MDEEEKKEETKKEDIKERAKKLGWKDKEDYDGDPDNFVSAENFVEKGERILPIMKERLRAMERKNDITKRELEELRNTTIEFKKMLNESFATYKKRAEVEITDLKKERKRAINDGDAERAEEIDAKIDAVKESVPVEKAKEADTRQTVSEQVDPAWERWCEKNSWYWDDPELREYAVAVAKGGYIQNKNPNVDNMTFYNAVKAEVVARFPEKFGGKKGNSGVNDVDAGGDIPRRGSGKKHSYENLPSDAKKACDSFIKQGLMSKEEYCNTYQWEE